MSGHDDWFKHDASEPKPQEMHGKINPYGIMLSLLLTLVAVAVTIIVVLKLGFDPAIYENKAERLEARTAAIAAPAQEKLANWENRLNTAAWIDPAKGIVRLPLDQARQKVIQEYAAK